MRQPVTGAGMPFCKPRYNGRKAIGSDDGTIVCEADSADTTTATNCLHALSEDRLKRSSRPMHGNSHQ